MKDFDHEITQDKPQNEPQIVASLKSALEKASDFANSVKGNNPEEEEGKVHTSEELIRRFHFPSLLLVRYLRFLRRPIR